MKNYEEKRKVEERKNSELKKSIESLDKKLKQV
jgi:hypothetical protein